eukprot:3652830-Alexandrium_andersonii.AAC.1
MRSVLGTLHGRLWARAACCWPHRLRRDGRAAGLLRVLPPWAGLRVLPRALGPGDSSRPPLTVSLLCAVVAGGACAGPASHRE